MQLLFTWSSFIQHHSSQYLEVWQKVLSDTGFLAFTLPRAALLLAFRHRVWVRLGGMCWLRVCDFGERMAVERLGTLIFTQIECKRAEMRKKLCVFALTSLVKGKTEEEAADFQGCDDMPQCTTLVRTVQQSWLNLEIMCVKYSSSWLFRREGSLPAFLMGLRADLWL